METERNYVKTGPTTLFEMENGPKHLFLREKKYKKKMVSLSLQYMGVSFLWLMSIEPVLI